MNKTFLALPILFFLQVLPGSATVEPLLANGVCEEIYLEVLLYEGIDDNEARKIYENCLDLVGK